MLLLLKPISFYVVLNLYMSFKSEWAPVQELTILKVLMIYENNTHLKYMYGFTVYTNGEKEKYKLWNLHAYLLNWLWSLLDF